MNFTKDPVIKVNKTIINSNNRKAHTIISKNTNKNKSEDSNNISSSESGSSLKNNDNNIPKNSKTCKSIKIINDSIESPDINNKFNREIKNNNSIKIIFDLMKELMILIK